MTRHAYRHRESDIQISCVAWFRLQYPEFAHSLFSVPNGGARNAVTASILKAEGCLPGVSDLILLVPRKGFHALLIEMKTDKGRQQDSQKAFQKAGEANGYKYIICRSLDEFRNEVEAYLGKGRRGKL